MMIFITYKQAYSLFFYQLVNASIFEIFASIYNFRPIHVSIELYVFQQSFSDPHDNLLIVGSVTFSTIEKQNSNKFS